MSIETRVALLRGINVGGKHRLPMKVLAALFADAGCDHVRTYIQSGNVVYRARPLVATGVAEQVAGAIERRFGFRAPVVCRTGAELREVVNANPFATAGADPKTLYVAFLAHTPASNGVVTLDRDRSPPRPCPDEAVVIGAQVYLHLPNGAARTRFTNAYLDARLATTSTVRGWRTVLRLVDMVTSQEGDR